MTEPKRTESSRTATPYSFEERLLLKSSSPKGAGSSSSSSSSFSSTKTETVRLESLAQWKDDAWIHPFSDIDIGLSSSSSSSSSSVDFSGSNKNLHRHYNGKIARVHMSISSHGTREFFPNYSNSLDGVPVLQPWKDDDDSSSSRNSNDRYISTPQGFSLSVRPFAGLTPEEEAKAVQAVFEELIRRRLLTTPVTNGEWDVRNTEESAAITAAAKTTADELSSLSPRLYQLVMPFDGAAWSSDALTQSFRRTLPKVCSSSGKNSDRFFGWSGLEWSDFLVGYKDGGGELGKGKKQPQQYPTFSKVMWWTWTSTSTSTYYGKNKSGDSTNNNRQGLSFGIQYQTIVPANSKNWLPNTFVEEDSSSTCTIGKRSSFEVLPVTAKASAGSYRLVPLKSNNNNHALEEKQEETPNFSYSVNIDQVLRRHHTNQGRFESSIQLKPLFDAYQRKNRYDDPSPQSSCRMTYRQIFPNFLTPMWRTLKVVNGDTTDANQNNGGAYYYTDSDQLHASVEWNPKDQSSILSVEANSSPSSASSFLPPIVFISLEYAPSFLTIDDFPGDPNRGRVLPPATVTVRCDPLIQGIDASSKVAPTTPTVVYSNGLLLLPPVPDLSMPFNVISFTSSFYAYMIGAIATLLVRKASEKIKYTMYPDTKPDSKLKQLKEKLRGKVDRVKSKLFGGTTSKTNESENTKKGDDDRSQEESAETNTAASD